MINLSLMVDPEISVQNARKIAASRKQLIHAYDNISDENIWGIAMNHLPNLKTEIESG